MASTYAALTRDDPNPVKRWLQRRRLSDAFRAAGGSTPGLVVDYGGGDGAMSAMAVERWPGCRVICFEPAEALAGQARELLAAVPRAKVVLSEQALPEAAADLIFCTEVFEHLPAAETAQALDEIVRVLKPGGLLVVGVPVEVGAPALPKGLFRMARRAGKFDARLGPILSAVAGRPPSQRETAEIAPGRFYFPHHLGFDHRRLTAEVGRRLRIVRLAGSPAPWLPVALNSEAYLTARKPG
jgi:SAM-dependent methyltransferase